MLLELPESDEGIWRLVMSPVEWKEVYALAKFVQAAIAYDAQAAYVAQVLVYYWSQPADILVNKNVQAAFDAVARLQAEFPANAVGGELLLRLPKEEMRQLLFLLGTAAESEDQADIIHDGEPDKFPHGFPAAEIEVASSHYAEAFDNLLTALNEDRTLSIARPVYKHLSGE